MKITMIFILIVLLAMTSALSFTCTGINVTKNGITIFGNNEDSYTMHNYAIDFIPPGNGKYGIVYFRRATDTWEQGGMNDQGLCFDGYGTPDVDIIFSSDKLPYNGPLANKIMGECATVEEALSIINEYRFNGLERGGQLMFVDKTGDSIIVGGRAEDNDIEIIRKHKNYQVVTNFFISWPELGGYPCWRYDRAVTMLEENDDATIENVRSILDAVHYSENVSAPTIYSYVCDLQNGAIYLYKMHNFQEFILVNLEEELPKGWNSYLINEIFSDIRLVAPAQEESVVPSQVTFSWEGKTNSRYRLYCCTDPNFGGCEPVEVENVSSLGTSSETGIGFLFIGFFSLGIFAAAGTRKKNLRKFIVLLIILVFAISCQHHKENEIIPPENEEVSVGEISVTLDNLQSGTIYYWKVTANSTDHFTSETIVRTFTTAN